MGRPPAFGQERAEEIEGRIEDRAVFLAFRRAPRARRIFLFYFLSNFCPKSRQMSLICYTSAMNSSASSSISSLEKEVKMLRSFAVSIVGRDEEGVYKPVFVRAALRATQIKPTHRFKDAKAFLAQLEK